MSEINKRILDMVSKGFKPSIICKNLNISLKELKRRLESIKYDGHNIECEYYYDGTRRYKLGDEPENINTNNKVSIKGMGNNQVFKFIAISDTHIGHKKSNINYVYDIYEYSDKKDINMFVHCGDLLEGSSQPIMSLDDQLEYFLKNYPVKENALTFVAFGNHDEIFVKEKHINLNTFISKNRDDIIPIGFKHSIIDVLSNEIVVSHEGKFLSGPGLKLAGHSHRFKFSSNNYNNIIVCPTLSDYLHTSNYPGAVEVHIAIESGKFVHLILKHLTINDKNIVKETSTIDVPMQKKMKGR